MGEVNNRDTLIWLSSINISSSSIDLLMVKFPNISDLWYIPDGDILKIKGLRKKTKERIIHYRDKEYLEKFLLQLKKTDTNVVTIFDNTYPKNLKYIDGSPKVLYYKGNILEKDNLSIAIVGSRKATGYGMWASERLGEELAKLDITVISGMANGIDTGAHKGALRENARTIAVLGSGIDVIYPARNKKLYHSICKNGAVITEYSPGTKPFPYNFPQRNRIISGLSLGVVVVEAEEKSGSLITAELAAEQGKEVFAVPGNINSLFSKGTNKLIKDGAKIVMNVDDIIEEIYELREKIKKIKKTEIDHSKLSETESLVIKSIEKGLTHCDSIVHETGLDITTVTSTLTVLELKGFVKEMAGKTYTLI